MNNSYKAGDRFVYSEDGYHLVIEILINKSTSEMEEYKIKVLGIIQRSPFLGDTNVGDEIEISRIWTGYPGMWHLRTFDEFARDSEARFEAVESYRN